MNEGSSIQRHHASVQLVVQLFNTQTVQFGYTHPVAHQETMAVLGSGSVFSGAGRLVNSIDAFSEKMVYTCQSPFALLYDSPKVALTGDYLATQIAMTLSDPRSSS